MPTDQPNIGKAFSPFLAGIEETVTVQEAFLAQYTLFGCHPPWVSGFVLTLCAEGRR